MALKDEIKAERQSLKGAPLKEKLQYFKDYYLGKTVVLVIILAILISGLVSFITRKEIALAGVMLNCLTEQSEREVLNLTEDFLQSQGLDPQKSEVDLNTSLLYTTESNTNTEENYATIEVLSAQISGRLLDFVIGDLDSVSMFAYSEFFHDLREILTEEQLVKYEPYLLYIDMAVVRQLEQIAETEDYDADIQLPDPTKPELMEEPVPVFLDVSGSRLLQTVYPDAKGKLVISAAANAVEQEMLTKFVDFLMEEN